MIMLRGTPDSYASSQRTLLTPYGAGAGAGTPEEEEELALLEHLEKVEMGQSAGQGGPKGVSGGKSSQAIHPQMTKAALEWPSMRSPSREADFDEPESSASGTQPQAAFSSGLQSWHASAAAPQSTPRHGWEAGSAVWPPPQLARMPAASGATPEAALRLSDNKTGEPGDLDHPPATSRLVGGPFLAAVPAPGLGQPGRVEAPNSGPHSMTDETPGAARLKSPQPGKQTREPVPGGQAGNPPSTTIRIGDYPAYKTGGHSKDEMDAWNAAFRTTYGAFAVNAAGKVGVPARLLAALSANEMAAVDWTEFDAFADRHHLGTKSTGPLQIATQTALRYRLVPVDNEFYGAGPDTIWTSLHDPDVRFGQASAPSGLTPGQRLARRDDPFPNNPRGYEVVHDYLDNPATGFEAGAKLLDIYLKKLSADYMSGAYLNYSKDFKDLTGLSREGSDIHKDLEVLASGDKQAIFNLQPGPSLARAVAMMWNNGEGIVKVNNLAILSPGAYNHGVNMGDQHTHQDDLIPAMKNTRP